ncbi:hypothetical protein [Caproiciproducens galactitolivorans]|uniref:Uncharacterized protein n=1 Tax=Caproiciproducens galactitolivorans TaxID=642589 RepID=A0ABT4BSV7_9FIRM|nr:hypothetical protein [Caproiciproducens galactitolivorans]MCY1713972.1 hypothetical protein [Caproiciproducens galactitolivorans]
MINVFKAWDQSSRLNTYVVRLKSSHKNLSDARDLLNGYWQAEEMGKVNEAIENALSKLKSTSSKLETLSDNILEVAKQIRKEEEEEAAREARKRAQRAVEQGMKPHNI